jgi:hypothetical protein
MSRTAAWEITSQRRPKTWRKKGVKPRTKPRYDIIKILWYYMLLLFMYKLTSQKYINNILVKINIPI